MNSFSISQRNTERSEEHLEDLESVVTKGGGKTRQCECARARAQCEFSLNSCESLKNMHVNEKIFLFGRLGGAVRAHKLIWHGPRRRGCA